MRQCPIAIVLLLLAAWPAGAAIYYVDQDHPRAADDGPGAEAQPWKTIGRAAQTAAPGDTVRIRTGVYREKVTIEKSGTAEKPIRFEADTAAVVVVTGADRITQWTREAAADPLPGAAARPGEGPVNNLFSTPWPHRFITHSKTHTHPGDAEHLMIGRAEQVIVLGYPLLQVLRRDKLTRGTFYVDLEAKRLYVWTSDDADLAKGRVPVEASTREVIWDCRGDYVVTAGLRFRYAANRAQHAAAQFRGAHAVVEDCVFERTNSIGAMFAAPDIVVRRCTFADNGQLGFSANRAHRLLVTECLVRNNNTKNFGRGWEAGANKLVFCRGVVLEKSRFIENRGTGIWFDIGNDQNTVRNCLIADNEDAGIFYEISYALHVHDNVITGNGFAGTPGSWGAAAGVALSSSPGCVVERNLLVGNKEGFNFREQLRTTPTIEEDQGRAVWNHDQVIRRNLLAYNRDAQTWGWFDVNDQRHWPKAMQEKAPGKEGTAADDLAKGYQAKDASGQPVGLSLEALKLTLADNLFAVLPGQGLFHWGVTWKRHQKYTSLDAVRKELNLETGSQVAAIRFANPAARDFRVPKDSPALKLGCYPQGDVPGVRLGTME